MTQGGPSPGRFVEDGKKSEQQAGKSHAQAYGVEGRGGLEGLFEYAKRHLAPILGRSSLPIREKQAGGGLWFHQAQRRP